MIDHIVVAPTSAILEVFELPSVFLLRIPRFVLYLSTSRAEWQHILKFGKFLAFTLTLKPV